MQSAFGLAKNVNARQPGARRAASAYHIGGRHLSPSSSSSSLSSLAQIDAASVSSGEGQDVGTPSLLALSAMSPSSLSSSSSCSSIASMVNGDLKALNHGDRLGNPTPGDLVAKPQDQEMESHFSQRGSGVDKTNPFIGYFQTGSRGAAAAPGAAPSVAVAAGSSSNLRDGLLGSHQYSSSAVFNKQKKLTEWIGSRSSRLPSFFVRRDEKPPLSSSKKPIRAVVPTEEADGTVEIAPVALFADYTMTAATVVVDEKKDGDVSETNAKGIDQLVKDEERTDTLASRRRASSSSSTLSTTSSSRFEQDFEIIGTLGEGGQGMVYKVCSKVDECEYAIKKVMLPRTLQRGSPAFQQALREVKAMAGMSPHANVVRYHTAWLEEEFIEHRTPVVESRVNEMAHQGLVDESESEESVASSFFSQDNYSVGSLSQFEGSMGGFQFAEPSQSIIAEAEQELLKTVSRRPLQGVQEDVREDESVASSDSASQPDIQLVLYIQMELCGAAANAPITESEEDQEGDSFQRLINRLTLKPQTKRVNKNKGEVVHTTLSSWLRGSVDARADPDENFTKHREGLKLFLGVVDGVQHMHESGIIHRDLKPDNIFIHGDIAKIGDFGLSKSISSDIQDVHGLQDAAQSSSTSEDHTTALGTFTYASPEQLGYSWNRIKGSADHVVKSAKYSIKSDIFALGIILLELCYPCSTMMERSQVLTGVRHGVVPQVALQRFPSEMAMVLRMTAMDPAERPTTEEITEQLRSLLATKEALNARAAIDDLRDIQQKLALAMLQLRDRSQAAQQLESLIAELSDKVQTVGLAIA